jgi:hypothetical protein
MKNSAFYNLTFVPPYYGNNTVSPTFTESFMGTPVSLISPGPTSTIVP